MNGDASRFAGLAGRTALVTGAARGLGAAVVRRLLDHGCSVTACDVDATGLAQLTAAANGTPTDARLQTATVDLASPQACTDLVDQVMADWGYIDILVNNAAVLARKPIAEVSVEEFDNIIAVNLRAPFLLSRQVLPGMRRRGWGRIVNVASVAVRTGGSSDVAVYAASKGGLVALTKAFAKVAAPDGVLVSALLPAGMDTPMVRDGFDVEAIDRIRSEIPLGRLSTPAEIAESVLWLASDAASYVCGASVDVNGGWIMP